MRTLPNDKRQELETRLSNAKISWRSASQQQKEQAVIDLFDLVQDLLDRAFPDYSLPDEQPQENN